MQSIYDKLKTYFDVVYIHDNIEYRDIMSIDDMRQQLKNEVMK